MQLDLTRPQAELMYHLLSQQAIQVTAPDAVATMTTAATLLEQLVAVIADADADELVLD